MITLLSDMNLIISSRNNLIAVLFDAFEIGKAKFLLSVHFKYLLIVWRKECW